MNKALDRVRAGESGRIQREGRNPILKKSRWLLLKRSENLQDEQHCRLREICSATTSRPSVPTFLRKPFSSSGTTTPRLGPVSSSTSGAAKRCDPASNP